MTAPCPKSYYIFQEFNHHSSTAVLGIPAGKLDWKSNYQTGDWQRIRLSAVKTKKYIMVFYDRQ